MRRISSFTETALPNCPATQKIVQNYASLKVISFDDLYLCESLLLQRAFHGITNAKRTNRVGRASHALLLSHSKEPRKRFTVDDEALTEVDASCLHCYLLAHFITDAAEKQRWLKICEEDAYFHFGAKNDTERERYKRKLQQALSNKEKGKTAQAIISYIQTNFPNPYSWIEARWAKGATVQSQLQQLEAKIFIDRSFLTAPFWCLPLHDCLLVKESDKEIAVKLLKEAAFSTLGFNLKFDDSSIKPVAPAIAVSPRIPRKKRKLPSSRHLRTVLGGRLTLDKGSTHRSRSERKPLPRNRVRTSPQRAYLSGDRGKRECNQNHPCESQQR